jgi:hypothetical protein
MVTLVFSLCCRFIMLFILSSKISPYLSAFVFTIYSPLSRRLNWPHAALLAAQLLRYLPVCFGQVFYGFGFSGCMLDRTTSGCNSCI